MYYAVGPVSRREAAAPHNLAETLRSHLGRQVVLDTAGPITYLGTLREVVADGFWLEDADVRDRSEGHDSKELYIAQAREHGIQVNRRRVFVVLTAVTSISLIEDAAAS